MLFKKTCIFNTRFFNEILRRCKSIIGLKESQSVLCQLYCSWWGLSERNRLKENTKQQQQKTNTKTIKQTDKKNVIGPILCQLIRTFQKLSCGPLRVQKSDVTVFPPHFAPPAFYRSVSHSVPLSLNIYMECTLNASYAPDPESRGKTEILCKYI